MKSLAALAFAVVLGLGSAADAVAQQTNVTSPALGSFYGYNVQTTNHATVPVDVTLNLYSSPLSPTVMYVYMYEMAYGGGSSWLVPSTMFPQGTALYLTSTGSGPNGSIAYRYQGTVPVYGGHSYNYFLHFTFYDPYVMQFVPDPWSGQPYYANSGVFGSVSYSTW